MLIEITYDEFSKKCRINPECIELVREHFSVENIQARIKKKLGYKLPKRTYIISPNGICDPCFVFEILKYVKSLDIPYQLKMDETSLKIVKPKIDNIKIVDVPNIEYKYRDYQLSSLNKIIECGRGIIRVGTGGGKSLVIAGFIESVYHTDNNIKILINVPNLGLVEQLYKDFEDYKCSFTASKWTGSHDPDLSCNVIIVNTACICGKDSNKILKLEQVLYDFIKSRSQQSYKEIYEILTTKNTSILKGVVLREKKYKSYEEFLSKNNHTYLKKFIDRIDNILKYKNMLEYLYINVQYMIIDECHDVNSSSKLGDVIDKFQTHNKIGFTGTLSKDDLDKWICLGKIGPVIYTKKSESLRKEKYISNAEIKIIKVHHKKSPDYISKENLIKPTENYIIEKDFIYNSEYRKKFVKGVCNHYNKNVLILVENIDYAEKLYTYLSQNTNKRVHYIHGNVDVDDREKIKQLMETDNDVVCIAISKIFTVGISIKNLPIIITINFGKSFIKIIQGIGRGLRLHENKEKLILFDLCDNLVYSKRHIEERMKYYQEEKFEFKLENIYEP